MFDDPKTTADRRALAKDEEDAAYSGLSTPYFLTLALLSGGGIFLEIALTRLFSTLFFSPTVFAILSIAVLGIGLGAALATWRPAWRALTRLHWYLILAGGTTLLLLLIGIWTVAIDWPGALLGLVVWPYFFTGLALATIFSTEPAASPRLYRADLLGAGLGAVMAIPLLSLLGGVNGVMVAAGVFGLAALVIAPRMIWSVSFCGLILIGLSTNLAPASQWLAIDMARLSSGKPITDSLAAGGEIIHTAWDAFARTDLVDPGQGMPYELYIDGAAGSVMPPAGDLNLLRADIGFFPFATRQPERVLIIGPGGGLDVWFALSGQARTITAVEVNPASVNIVNQFAAYNGDLYGRPEVRASVDEGRSLLRRAGERYDLIYLSQVVTLAAERNGYVLTENTIYTVEAFADYLAHLQPGGLIAMKLYDELTLTRAVVTALTALRQARGLSDAEAMAHIAAFLDPKATPPIPLLLIQDRPFSQSEAVADAGVAAQVGFVPLFVPGGAGNPTLNGVLAGTTTVEGIVAASEADISATTDDRPFFYQFERGLPAHMWLLLGGLGVVLLLGLPGLIIAQRSVTAPFARYGPLYFAALGVGFMTVEVALIQQTRLFLGHPTLAVTTVLAVLLVGGGVGSGLAGRWTGPTQRHRLAWPALGVVSLVLLWAFLWPRLSQIFFAGEILTRVLVVTISLLPLALLMGMPFPQGLRAVGQFPSGDRHVALGWTVNGVMTVVGSTGAVALALLAGFGSVLLVGAGAYLLTAVVAYVTCR
jgi:hypothetical protein